MTMLFMLRQSKKHFMFPQPAGHEVSFFSIIEMAAKRAASTVAKWLAGNVGKDGTYHQYGHRNKSSSEMADLRVNRSKTVF